LFDVIVWNAERIGCGNALFNGGQYRTAENLGQLPTSRQALAGPSLSSAESLLHPVLGIARGQPITFAAS
jgi:hypothetical protein